ATADGELQLSILKTVPNGERGDSGTIDIDRRIHQRQLAFKPAEWASSTKYEVLPLVPEAPALAYLLLSDGVTCNVLGILSALAIEILKCVSTSAIFRTHAGEGCGYPPGASWIQTSNVRKADLIFDLGLVVLGPNGCADMEAGRNGLNQPSSSVPT